MPKEKYTNRNPPVCEGSRRGKRHTHVYTHMHTLPMIQTTQHPGCRQILLSCFEKQKFKFEVKDVVQPVLQGANAHYRVRATNMYDEQK